jgi:hypothetical protein
MSEETTNEVEATVREICRKTRENHYSRYKIIKAFAKREQSPVNMSIT